MEYIVTKRMKKSCLGGWVNLAYGTVCEAQGDVICRKIDGKPICAVKSQDAYDYLSRNDDGNGRERGALVNDIKYLLQTPVGESQKSAALHKQRWGRVWAAEAKIGRFRRQEHSGHWLWNFDFYNAEISDLKEILNIVKGA